jgi:RNA polymerase sigma factor (TIGR02999 family)
MQTGPQEVTRLLRAWRAGDQEALAALTPLVYDELHRLAAGYMRGERPGHTLSPTALIGEAFVRLLGDGAPSVNDRGHFIAIAARLMRQILVDRARRRRAEKRGGGQRPVTLDDEAAGLAPHPDAFALGEALEQLAAIDEQKARIVELRHFGGLSCEEIGDVLGLHAKTTARELRLGEAWLRGRLRDGG